MYTYQHSDGVAILYENQTTNLVLEEEIEFNIKGLEIEGNEKSNKANVKVKPQDH